MALITPILLAVNAFDATQAYAFQFSVGAGGFCKNRYPMESSKIISAYTKIKEGGNNGG